MHPGNTSAYALYQRCADQLIVGPMGGAVGINILAVKCVMDLMRIPGREQDDLMLQVQELAGLIIGERARERERQEEKNKTRG